MALYNGLQPDETENNHSIYDPETGELPKTGNKTESPEDLQRAEQSTEGSNSSLADKNEGASLSKDSAQDETPKKQKVLGVVRVVVNYFSEAGLELVSY